MRIPLRARRATDKIVLLQGILADNSHDRFMTGFDHAQSDAEICTINDGTVAYRVLGYASDIAEGQLMLYGRVFT